MDSVIPIEDYEHQRQRGPRLRTTDTNTILATEYEPIRWIVPGYVPEGFSVLAGRQKLGKTWLAIDFALAVACGGLAMGTIGVEQGDVLYVDMENGPRRIQRRIRQLYSEGATVPNLSCLRWATEAKALDKGFLDELEHWRQTTPKPRLVVIDVLQRIKPAGIPTRNSYENDYSTWAPLQAWAMEHGIAVVGLHHTRKGGADDPVEALSGSNGLSAVADTTIVLDRNSTGITLYVRGRDVDEKESAMHFHEGRWTVSGDASEVRRSNERTKIIDALHDAGGPASIPDLVAATGMSSNSLRQLLFKMVKAVPAEAMKVARGCYCHPSFYTPNNNNNEITNDAESPE